MLESTGKPVAGNFCGCNYNAMLHNFEEVNNLR